MMKYLNTAFTGILVGIILPIIIFFVFYQVKYQQYEMIDIPNKLLVGRFLPILISWCVLPNLIVFFIFNWLGWLKSGKGIIISSAVITLVIIIAKLVYSLS